MIVFTNRRREGFGAERIATEDGVTVADRRLIFKKFKAGKFSMGAFQFLVQVQPDEPPHPSPRPSPLWYVFSAPTALKAWSPGFGRNSSGGNRGNRDFPKVGCGLEVAWVLHLSVSVRDLPKTLFGLMFMTLFPLLSHVQLLPVLSQAKEMGRRAACTNNNKQDSERGTRNPGPIPRRSEFLVGQKPL